VLKVEGDLESATFFSGIDSRLPQRRLPREEVGRNSPFRRGASSFRGKRGDSRDFVRSLVHWSACLGVERGVYRALRR